MHELSIKPLYDSTAYVNPRVFAIFSYNILFKHKALQKGTAKVTIKTISGKSAKVTIKIAE